MAVETFSRKFLEHLQLNGPECPFQVMIETSDALDIDNHPAYERTVYDLISNGLIEPARASKGEEGLEILYRRFRLN
ncbi:MAG: hypothetical protein ACP5NS_03095 [Candidatus Pacearchaeota archaeon]